MAEVVLDEHVVLKGKLRTRLFEIGEDDHPIGGQLMGSRPEQFAEAANDLVEAGYDSDRPQFRLSGQERFSAAAAADSCLSEPENALAIVKAVDRKRGRPASGDAQDAARIRRLRRERAEISFRSSTARLRLAQRP